MWTPQPADLVRVRIYGSFDHLANYNLWSVVQVPVTDKFQTAITLLRANNNSLLVRIKLRSDTVLNSYLR